MEKPVTLPRTILELWPSMAALARDLDRAYPTVQSWFYRGNWPASEDMKIIAAAQARGFDVTYEKIAAAREAWAKHRARGEQA